MLTLLMWIAAQDAAISDLGSDDADVRTRATQELIQLGDAAIGPACAALAATDDPEVAARLRAVLRAVDPWFESRRLAELPGDFNVPRLVFAMGGRGVAFTELGHSKWRMDEFHGTGLREFRNVQDVAFSPDGMTGAFKVMTGEFNWLNVVGEIKGEACDWVGEVVFSPDGKQWAYQASGQGCRIVRNGSTEEAFDSVDYPVFSADGRHLAYSATKEGREFIVLDGKRGESFESARNPVFSPDGTRIAFTAWHDGLEFTVVDGRRGPLYDLCGFLTFTPDGTDVVYMARRNRKEFIVSRGAEGEAFDEVRYPVLSANGKSIAFCSRTGGITGDRFVVCNGKRGKPFFFVRDVALSPDGSTVAYRADVTYMDKVIVVGDRSSKVYDEVTAPCFSPDGKVVAYSALTNATWDRESRPPRHTGGEWIVRVGEKTSEPFDQVGPLEFSSDSKKIGFGAQKGRELWWIVMEVE